MNERGSRSWKVVQSLTLCGKRDWFEVSEVFWKSERPLVIAARFEVLEPLSRGGMGEIFLERIS